MKIEVSKKEARVIYSLLGLVAGCNEVYDILGRAEIKNPELLNEHYDVIMTNEDDLELRVETNKKKRYFE